MKRQPFPPEPHCLSPQQPVRTRCSTRAPEMSWGLSPGWRVHAGLLSMGPGPEPGSSKAASLLGRGAPQGTALRSLPGLWLPSTPASPPPPARSEDFQHPTPSRLHHHPHWAPPCPLSARPPARPAPAPGEARIRGVASPPPDTLRAHGDRRGGPPWPWAGVHPSPARGTDGHAQPPAPVTAFQGIARDTGDPLSLFTKGKEGTDALPPRL